MENYAQTLYEWGSERKIGKSEINEYGKIFDFLSDYCDSRYPDSPRKHITYEIEIERCLKPSWKILRKTPIILNKKNCLLPAYKNGEPTPFVEITEIANYGIEMPQLNLCLCKNCSSKYKKLRDARKDKLKENLTKDIEVIDINIPAEDYAIELTQDCSVHFTQTHLGEVKEMLSLLAKYGTPGDH